MALNGGSTSPRPRLRVHMALVHKGDRIRSSRSHFKLQGMTTKTVPRVNLPRMGLVLASFSKAMGQTGREKTIAVMTAGTANVVVAAPVDGGIAHGGAGGTDVVATSFRAAPGEGVVIRHGVSAACAMIGSPPSIRGELVACLTDTPTA